jgi:hypothetical protein
MADDTSSKRPRKAVGPDRRVYFNHGDVDRVMAVLLALVSEVAAIRDRLDAHERLSAGGTLPAFETVEKYLPDPDTESAREAWRDAYIRRLFRVITEDVENVRSKIAESESGET